MRQTEEFLILFKYKNDTILPYPHNLRSILIRVYIIAICVDITEIL